MVDKENIEKPEESSEKIVKPKKSKTVKNAEDDKLAKSFEGGKEKNTKVSKKKKIATPSKGQENLDVAAQNIESTNDVREALDLEEELNPEKQIEKIINSYKEIHDKDFQEVVEKIKKISPNDPYLQQLANEAQIQSSQLINDVKEDKPIIEEPVAAVAEEMPKVEEPVAAVAEEMPEIIPTFSFTPEELDELLSSNPAVDENTPQISTGPFEVEADENNQQPNIPLPINPEETVVAKVVEKMKIDVRQEFKLNEESTRKAISYLQQTMASIEIRIDDPRLVLKNQPDIIKPAPLIDDPKNEEFVYPIYDFNDRLVTSKSLGHSEESLGMLKMFQTIEKMIFIMHGRIKELNSSGGNDNDEIKVYLDGHILCKRKMFEVIINLTENWIVMNFDPQQWGNIYLDALQKLYKKGYPYPPGAPRTSFQYKNGVIPTTPSIQAKS